MSEPAEFSEENNVSAGSPTSKSEDTPRPLSADNETGPLSPASSCSTPPASVTVSTSKAPVNTSLNYPRQNHVTNVMLVGIPIVSLFIDGKERLCLAQISNTHLKSYSYNEIHNRRVALGITCVQCTPVQLEILRRAGAMPVSSRRCGMITKREAERLVKSFLEDNTPPKLPEDFSFDVQHDCGWGCRGFFEPSRYNSSRAKCIKCRFCNIYFSPNKFIFHFHRAPDAKYNHPDAANFNSWRRHLKLTEGAADDITFLWEDVKAMFNGGSRKRVLSSSIASTSSSNSVTKKAKMPTDTTYMSAKPFTNQYQTFGMFSPHSKQYQYGPVNNSFGYTQPPHNKEPGDPHKSVMSPSPWAAQSNVGFPSYDMFWANTLALSRSGAIRNGYYSNMSKHMLTDSFARATGQSDKKLSKEDDINDNKAHTDRLSAFRPVGRTAHVQSGDQSGSERAESCASPDDEENEEIDVTYDTDDDERLSGSDDDVTKTDCDISKDTCDDVATGENQEITEDKAQEGDPQEVRKEETNNNKGEVQALEDVAERTMADSGMSDQSDSEAEKELVHFTKEELYEQWKKESDNRRRVEKEVSAMRETYSEQVSREKSYRDEMAHQLQVVRDTLTTELEQERKVRFALQQKLKEAHDALHSFSCKMLASRQCDECSYKESPLPR
ncbi:SKI family transcriptional corepressor 1 homolog-B-like isoform X1 [Haliotis rubra]|uniref:SKI family transcriptional corepressor 1 homolog-B-like isoform X1 n=1 Tax=Haliotis rubra TaxID=36100 RepID=UPI001EE51CE7|nr:SKI family transcriptional corepressor 1 homolog-B-like isoform X1 [Haliotis rubra]